MTPELRKYLELDKIAIRLEAIDERAADAIRDVMDDIWFELSADERQRLDDRMVADPPRVLEPVKLPVTDTLFSTPVEPTQRPFGGDPIRGWRSAA